MYTWQNSKILMPIPDFLGSISNLFAAVTHGRVPELRQKSKPGTSRHNVKVPPNVFTAQWQHVEFVMYLCSNVTFEFELERCVFEWFSCAINELKQHVSFFLKWYYRVNIREWFDWNSRASRSNTTYFPDFVVHSVWSDREPFLPCPCRSTPLEAYDFP